MTHLKGIKALLVDNSATDIQEFLSYYTELSGGNEGLVVATNLEEAKKELNTQTFDVIIIDVNLPKMHDVDALTMIWVYAPTVPIIAISEDDTDDLYLEMAKRGAIMFISKQDLSSRLLKRAFLIAQGAEKNKCCDKINSIISKFDAIRTRLLTEELVYNEQTKSA